MNCTKIVEMYGSCTPHMEFPSYLVQIISSQQKHVSVDTNWTQSGLSEIID